MTNTAPTTDVTGMRLAHRMMTRDLVRLTDLARDVADGRTSCPDARAAAFARWVGLLATEIHHHHTVEDEVAWPVIARHAGAYVDLAVLTDDHAALDPLVAAARTAADRLVATREAAERRAAAAVLATELGALRDHLVEHVTEEERSLFPVIERYVPPADWARVEQAAQRGGPGMAFTLPRALAVMDGAERERLFGAVSAVQRVVFGLLGRVLVPRHERRERLLFGAG